MYEIKTEIEIDAPVEQVWSILTRFQDYPQWNPFIKQISGDLQAGSQLRVTIQPPNSKGMQFKPSVLAVKPLQELRWLGKLLLSGIFDGEHYFKLEAFTVGKTRLVQGEQFSGLLIPLAKSSLEKNTKAGFMAMNQALKVQAEKAQVENH